MNRVLAKCGSCGAQFQADEQMLAAEDALTAASVLDGLYRVAVFCPSCTSPKISRL